MLLFDELPQGGRIGEAAVEAVERVEQHSAATAARVRAGLVEERVRGQDQNLADQILARAQPAIDGRAGEAELHRDRPDVYPPAAKEPVHRRREDILPSRRGRTATLWSGSFAGRHGRPKLHCGHPTLG